MTNQNVVPAEAVAAIAVAAVAVASSPMFPYPPPCACDRKKKYVSQLELGGVRISEWMESIKASSPTHAKAPSVLVLFQSFFTCLVNDLSLERANFFFGRCGIPRR
ncbi:hypothetical protein Cni_G16928 [Canna indica]|uniref:Uncharacterized protein n=1 Tax=Canna indica TaxID=4628 RepID=A0AAQ3QG41_9LILI|nr:hypothetical protein Cni_G16928 [Canna indica]